MSFARTVVKMSHMPVDMQENAIQVAQEAIRDNNTEEAIAASIKKSFEGLYPAVWHCFVGRNFGCFVTHEASRFVYFYIGVYEKYGVTADNVAAKAVELIASYQGGKVPSIINQPHFGSAGGHKLH